MKRKERRGKEKENVSQGNQGTERWPKAVSDYEVRREGGK